MLKFESAGPGHRRLATLVADLPNIRIPDLGEYELVALLNGRRLGGSEFWVVEKPMDELGARFQR